MCEPVAIVSAAVSSAMMATQAVAGGIQANQQAKQQAKVANYNARMADLEAERVAEEGAKERGRKSLENALLKGRQIARGSAAGVDVWAADGSMQDVLNDTAYFGAADVAEMHNKNLYDINRYTIEAGNLRDQASAYKQSGKSALTGGLFGGILGLSDGVTNIYDRFYSSGGK